MTPQQETWIQNQTAKGLIEGFWKLVREKKVNRHEWVEWSKIWAAHNPPVVHTVKDIGYEVFKEGE